MKCLTAQSLDRTRNSVPRTPSIEEGVFTFIASGDCMAIFPDTTDSVPLRREDSKAPSCVVELNAYRSIASTLLGPTDRSESSTNAIPADPSAPVTTMSVACKCVPTRAGSRWPLRSRYTEPLATLNWAMSFAQLAIGAMPHTHARRNRRMTIERVDCIVTPNNWPAFQFRRWLAPLRAVCSYNNNPNGLLPAHPVNGQRPACPVPGQHGLHGRNPDLC